MYNPFVQPQDWTAAPLHLPLEQGPLRLADYLQLPAEPRCEIWRGNRIVTAAPRIEHQRIVGVLYEYLARYARAAGGLAILSPVDVVLADDIVVQPDLVFLRDENIARADRWVSGAPDLAIEVVSPSESRRDRLFKRNFYLEAGVSEYWIVDGDEGTIDFLVLRDGRYALEHTREEIYRSPTVPGLELHLTRLWKAIEDPQAEL